MTVKELIEELEKIEDKDKPVVYPDYSTGIVQNTEIVVVTNFCDYVELI